ncbi:hypothetical protein ACFE04_009084 [Oxalis oulophora]
MVQRKVPKKLGIIITPASSDRRVINKPESPRSLDLKKKMKKSRPFKVSDAESKKLSSKNNISLPGKPPPVKSPMVYRSSSPNYMKSTSSSEHKQVSPLTTKTASSSGDETNVHHQKNSKSGSKQDRDLTKSSGLKLARKLTKIPSFKKSSRLVISVPDMKSQNPTCSSTLKDAKFPLFLELNHGGTEAEGTSAMKVCPYTYCSLNGHHHPPLPPLKCFMSAKRRALKMQKSFKLGALSPRSAKPRAKTEEIDSSEDFFVEIYGKTEDPDTFGDIYRDINNSDKEFDGPEVAKSLSDGSPKSEIDFEENFEEYSDFMPIEIEVFSKEQRILETQEEESVEGDCASVEEGDNFSEITDMEWEEGQFYPSVPDSGEATANEDDHEEMMKSPDGCIDYVIITDEFIFVDVEKIFADEVLLDVHEEESACYDAPNESDSEMDGVVLDSSQVSGSFLCYQDASAEDDQEVATEEVKQEGIEEMLESGVPESENVITEADNPSNYSDESQMELETDQSLQIDDENVKNDPPSHGDIKNIEDGSSVCQSDMLTVVVEQNTPENDEDHSNKRKIPSSADSEEQAGPKLRKIKSDDDIIYEAVDTPEVNNANTGIMYTHGTADGAKADSRRKSWYTRGSTNKKLQEQSDTLKWKIGRGRLQAEENENSWKFNPAEPNYLPLTLEPDKEKVDLKHQITDDRRNAEEFMSDYALQQAVSKLATAKKKKVALLVAAFETVSPVSKFDSPYASTRFTHSRPMQAFGSALSDDNREESSYYNNVAVQMDNPQISDVLCRVSSKPDGVVYGVLY